MANDPNSDGRFGDLLAFLARWSPKLILCGNEKLRRVCHQPERGQDAYLHTLYPNLSDDGLAGIEAIIGRPLPPKLKAFYAATNGARLFEGFVSASGLVTSFSRDPAISNPICIEQDNLAFAYLHADWHRRGYFRFGGISFMRQDELICGPQDCVVVLNGNTRQPLRRFDNVFDCLITLTREMGRFWTDEGTFTSDLAALDQLILAPTGTA